MSGQREAVKLTVKEAGMYLNMVQQVSSQVENDSELFSLFLFNLEVIKRIKDAMESAREVFDGVAKECISDWEDRNPVFHSAEKEKEYKAALKKYEETELYVQRPASTLKEGVAVLKNVKIPQSNLFALAEVINTFN